MDTTAELPASGHNAARMAAECKVIPDGVDLGADIARLRALVDRIQLARRGNAELDRQVDQALRRPLALPSGKNWSCDLGHAMALLPHSYNYSLGRRDGVCWAWTQPNDGWEPNEYEARHDHPGGSGFVVAHTSALAVACAAVILRIRRLEAARIEAASIEAGDLIAEGPPAM